MAADVYSKSSKKRISLGMLGLAAALAFAAPLRAAQTFTSGSDGSDGAYAPAASENFDPTKYTGNGVSKNVFNFTTITIPSGVTVKLSGDLINGPVYWLAQGNVDIEGTVDLSGQDGAPPAAILAARTRAIPGVGGFAGGVGGKYDVLPIPPGEPSAQPGDGPGGGSISNNQQSPCNNNYRVNIGYGGQNTANAFLVPLVGGSGGAGSNFSVSPGNLSNAHYGGGGGAGGGALLVASSTTITVNGVISANGGKLGSQDCFNDLSGGGAGGSIRLAAPTISGNGTLTVIGGRTNSSLTTTWGGDGIICLEAFTDTFSGSIQGIQHNGSPFNTFIPTTGPPSVTVTKVNGFDVTQPPTGNLATPDVTIDTSVAVQLTIQAQFIPPGTVLTLKVFSDNDTDQIVQTTPLLGTLESSTATATVTFPSGFSLNYVKATWANQ